MIFKGEAEQIDSVRPELALSKFVGFFEGLTQNFQFSLS